MEILDPAITLLIVIIAAIYLIKNITRNKGCSSCNSCKGKTGSGIECCNKKTINYASPPMPMDAGRITTIMEPETIMEKVIKII